MKEIHFATDDFFKEDEIDAMGIEEFLVEQEMYLDHQAGLRNYHGPNDGYPDRVYDEMRSGVGCEYFG